MWSGLKTYRAYNDNKRKRGNKQRRWRRSRGIKHVFFWTMNKFFYLKKFCQNLNILKYILILLWKKKNRKKYKKWFEMSCWPWSSMTMINMTMVKIIDWSWLVLTKSNTILNDFDLGYLTSEEAIFNWISVKLLKGLK